MNNPELISSLFLFDGYDFALLDANYGISDSVFSVRYKHGEVIMSTDSDTRGLAVVAEGEANIVSGESTRPVILRKVCAGDSFGAASLFRTSGDFNTRVIAEQDSTVLFLPKGTVIRLCTHVPQISFNYLRYLSDRTAFLNRKLSAFTAGSTDARLAVYLLGLPYGDDGKICIDICFSSLASMLGIGRASLYRALDNLCESKMIERDGKKVTLVNPKKLREMIQ